MRPLVDDPRAGASQSWTSWPEQTPDVVPFLADLPREVPAERSGLQGMYL